MPDISSPTAALPPPIDGWLLPLEGDQPCGPDLEYDPESLELADATGKPESQFGPGQPADWARVRDIAESLFTRTRDLRVALWWGRAKLNLTGFDALPATIGLFQGLLENFWDQVHPLPDPDDGDALARLSVIGGFDKLDSLLGDIRNARLSDDARLGGLRIRDVEIALSKLTPRADESPRTQGQVAGMVASVPEVASELRSSTDAALHSLKQLETSLSDRVGADNSVDLSTVRGMLTGLRSVLPAAPKDEVVAAEAAVSAPGEVASARVGGVHSVDSRQDAIQAIELVCAYLERHEPTNPAQLLLRRAARVIDKTFLQLVLELAPDSVKEVSRIMGVDPSTVSDES